MIHFIKDTPQGRIFEARTWNDAASFCNRFGGEIVPNLAYGYTVMLN